MSELYLGSVVHLTFPKRHSAASDSPEGLTEGLLDALHSGQRSFHGQLVTGVQSAPTGKHHKDLVSERGSGNVSGKNKLQLASFDTVRTLYFLFKLDPFLLESREVTETRSDGVRVRGRSLLL